ncbi:putative transcriptional regulator, ModE family [Thermodesulfatator indicus DSM 15286]|uniref:Transcriptional regulator, ModE family n=1 Tax=Thermodesulfatator indicus (strain DSM 15286 / JCM 11887 / CIR29812) TaxID=667014 RepID=F8AD03_THEID|nr:LysR family transcriptional regulator [Thermodesulfatator indicus]AEH45869.1 putative transcriptional regulator, ModE family [Thermodesulfatator indicus DSM 15286]
MKYFVKGQIWVSTEEGKPFLGPGRVALLRKIHELGSIRAAAKALGMSYRRAWRHVESLNQNAPKPLINTSTGGKGGGGATLTETGIAILKLFENLEEDFDLFLEKKSQIFQKNLTKLFK